MSVLCRAVRIARPMVHRTFVIGGQGCTFCLFPQTLFPALGGQVLQPKKP
jgi:hypothetical protein